MSFRRKRDAWDDFLKLHGAELRACGIPDEVTAKRLRFFLFLDHGFDEWGWAENRHACFDARMLTDEQISRLADLVGQHLDKSYYVTISSRWQRTS
ncbi:MAG: hypothetical protein JNM56_07755 [Planctomycetia bacterium]|nr:hypothetical protein [Planctomycetia bacterium]